MVIGTLVGVRTASIATLLVALFAKSRAPLSQNLMR